MRLDLDEDHSVNLVGRGWWGAEEVEETTPLELPVTWVRFTYEDITEGGENDVIEALADRQLQYMDDGFTDIPYNFMVDVDGTIYEGRGWKNNGQRPEAFQSLDKKCLEICYLGDFTEEGTSPPWDQLKAGWYLVMFGIKEGYVSRRYKTINLRDQSIPSEYECNE